MNEIFSERPKICSYLSQKGQQFRIVVISFKLCLDEEEHAKQLLTKYEFSKNVGDCNTLCMAYVERVFTKSIILPDLRNEL